MILQIGLSSLLIILTLVYYLLFFKPKKEMLWYKKTLEELGYKVQMYPYKFFGSTKRDRHLKDQKETNDAYYIYKKSKGAYDIVLYNIMNYVAIDLGTPQLLKEFYQPDNVYLYQKNIFMVGSLKRTLGNGLIFSEGETWKRKRKIMNSVFNYDFIKNNIPKIKRIIDQGLNFAENQAKEKNSDIQVQLSELFSIMYANVMLECFFGVQSNNIKIQDKPVPLYIQNLNVEALRQGFSLLGLLLGPKFLQLGLRKKDKSVNQKILIIRNLAQQLIDKRLEQIKQNGVKQIPTDIIQVKFKAHQAKKDEVYDHSELIDQFYNFYQAGTQTTANFMQMIVYYLILNPEIEQKLRRQVEDVIKNDEDINADNLKKLVYIDWIQNQTTRMYGPGTGIFARKVVKDHYIGNIPVKKGTCISIMTLGINYSEKFYKNPEEFRPERWENQCNQNPAFSFGGFSAGPRTCIGKHLALLESKITLIKLLLRYKSFSIPKLDFSMKLGFMYEPQKMLCRLQRFSS